MGGGQRDPLTGIRGFHRCFLSDLKQLQTKGQHREWKRIHLHDGCYDPGGIHLDKKVEEPVTKCEVARRCRLNGDATVTVNAKRAEQVLRRRTKPGQMKPFKISKQTRTFFSIFFSERRKDWSHIEL